MNAILAPSEAPKTAPVESVPSSNPLSARERIKQNFNPLQPEKPSASAQKRKANFQRSFSVPSKVAKHSILGPKESNKTHEIPMTSEEFCPTGCISSRPGCDVADGEI